MSPRPPSGPGSVVVVVLTRAAAATRVLDVAPARTRGPRTRQDVAEAQPRREAVHGLGYTAAVLAPPVTPPTVLPTPLVTPADRVADTTG